MSWHQISADYQYNDIENNIVITYKTDDSLHYIYLTLEKAKDFQEQLNKSIKRLELFND